MKLSKLFLNIFVVSLFLSLVGNKVSLSQPQAQQAQQLKSLGKEKFNYSQNIHHQLIGPRIITQFAPRNSQGDKIALDQLAAELGYDHFNWASYIVRDPYGIADRSGKTLSTPYNDPPQGGYQYDSADNLPFYWDLEQCQQCQPRHHWQNEHNLKPFELVFQDAPADYRLQRGEAIEFVTSLVGVKDYDADGKTARWEILHTYSWQLANPHPRMSQVSLLETDIPLHKLSPLLLSTMQLDGAELINGY